MVTVVDEVSLEQLKKENLRLQRELKAALATLDKLLKVSQEKNEKISHLENMLKQTTPVIQVKENKLAIEVSSESEIAELQLERLRKSARERVLTLEEIRAYDLLVKNKRLGQDQSTINLDKSSYRDVSDADLMQIAASSKVENNDPE